VAIKRLVANTEDLKRKHLNDFLDTEEDDQGNPHRKRVLTQHEAQIHDLLRRWMDERRAEGVMYTLKNVRMWAALFVLCLIVWMVPFPVKVRVLRWIIPMVLLICLPIISYILVCIEIERRYMEASGINELGSVDFNFLTGGAYLAQIKLDSVQDGYADSVQTGSKASRNVPAYLTVGFIAYRSGGDEDLDNEDDDDDDIDSDTGDEHKTEANHILAKKGSVNRPKRRPLGRNACEIRYLYVLPKYRRRGIAELLVETVCKDACEENQYDMVYFSLPADAPKGLVDFLQARNFRHVGLRPRLGHRDSYRARAETWIRAYNGRTALGKFTVRLYHFLRCMLLSAFNPLSVGVVTTRPAIRQPAGGPATQSERQKLVNQCKIALAGHGGEEEHVYARPLFSLDTTRLQVRAVPVSKPGQYVDRDARDELEQSDVDDDMEDEDYDGGLETDTSDEEKRMHRILRERPRRTVLGQKIASARDVRTFVPQEQYPRELDFDAELRRIKKSVEHEERMKRIGAQGTLPRYRAKSGEADDDLFESEFDSEAEESESQSDVRKRGRYTVPGVWAPATSTGPGSLASGPLSDGTGRAMGTSSASRRFFESVSHQAELAAKVSADAGASTRYVETRGGPQIMGDDQLEILLRGKARM